MCPAVVQSQAQKSSSQGANATNGRKERRRSSVFSNYVEKLLRQELPSCLSPIPSLFYSTFFFLLITLVTIPFGAAMFWQTRENTEVILRYDNFEDEARNTTAMITQTERRNIVIDPNINFTTTSQITTTEKLDSPVYVYYELTDYHQNHKRYVRSLSEQQLGGENPDAGSMTECDPYRIVPEDNSTTSSSSERVISPCGLVAHSLFNDSFILTRAVDRDQVDLQLEMDENGIATEWDRKYLYGDVPPENFNDDVARRGGGQIKGNLNEDEHFMVWMRVGSRPTVRKLYGIIRQDIPDGAVLEFSITHHYNTYDFDGKKKLVLATSNWTGGRNEFTGIIYFVTGTLSALACIVILVWDLKVDRTQGDLGHLSWNRSA